MKKQTIFSIILGCLILIGVIIFLKYNGNSTTDQLVEPVQNQSTTTVSGVVNTNTSVKPSPISMAPSKDLWTTFAQYLDRAANHDISGVASLSFGLSETCKDPKQQKECFAKMDLVREIGSQLKQEDFVHKAEDGKQAILATNIRRPNTENELVAARSTILFTKDAQGYPKILALNPNEMWTLQKNKASTTAELEARMQSFILDSDQDGVTDNLENCIFPENILQVTCKKTDPLKRDSNGDGWWDGIEPLLTQ